MKTKDEVIKHIYEMAHVSDSSMYQDAVNAIRKRDDNEAIGRARESLAACTARHYIADLAIQLIRENWPREEPSQ